MRDHCVNQSKSDSERQRLHIFSHVGSRFFFWEERQYLGLNSELCKTGTLLLEPHLQLWNLDFFFLRYEIRRRAICEEEGDQEEREGNREGNGCK
jgi:hypothetical protein